MWNCTPCSLLRLLLQMNALHEPWDDDALSEEISWGAAPALAQSADVLADTAASGGLPGLAGLGPGQEYQMAVTYRGAKVNSLLHVCGFVFVVCSIQMHSMLLLHRVQHMTHMIMGIEVMQQHLATLQQHLATLQQHLATLQQHLATLPQHQGACRGLLGWVLDRSIRWW
jgi:hypothetical protein